MGEEASSPVAKRLGGRRETLLVAGFALLVVMGLGTGVWWALRSATRSIPGVPQALEDEGRPAAPAGHYDLIVRGLVVDAYLPSDHSKGTFRLRKVREISGRSVRGGRREEISRLYDYANYEYDILQTEGVGEIRPVKRPYEFRFRRDQRGRRVLSDVVPLPVAYMPTAEDSLTVPVIYRGYNENEYPRNGRKVRVPPPF